MIPEATKVLIVGGGPCGLMLANELGRRNVPAVVIDAFGRPGDIIRRAASAQEPARGMEEQTKVAALPSFKSGVS
jgi:2-polyprenyl-6-methoxyphenol hydroxylase-like FAD-dependent oxidoreductase